MLLAKKDQEVLLALVASVFDSLEEDRAILPVADAYQLIIRLIDDLRLSTPVSNDHDGFDHGDNVLTNSNGIVGATVNGKMVSVNVNVHVANDLAGLADLVIHADVN